jgi:hypothetical protein
LGAIGGVRLLGEHRSSRKSCAADPLWVKRAGEAPSPEPVVGIVYEAGASPTYPGSTTRLRCSLSGTLTPPSPSRPDRSGVAGRFRRPTIGRRRQRARLWEFNPVPGTPNASQVEGNDFPPPGIATPRLPVPTPSGLLPQVNSVPVASSPHRPLVMIALRCGDGEESTPAGADADKLGLGRGLLWDLRGLDSPSLTNSPPTPSVSPRRTPGPNSQRPGCGNLGPGFRRDDSQRVGRDLGSGTIDRAPSPIAGRVRSLVSRR